MSRHELYATKLVVFVQQKLVFIFGGRRVTDEEWKACAWPSRARRATAALGTQGRRASCRNYSGPAAQSIFPARCGKFFGAGRVRGGRRGRARGAQRQGGRRSAAGRCNARRRPGRRADSRTATALWVGDHGAKSALAPWHVARPPRRRTATPPPVAAPMRLPSGPTPAPRYCDSHRNLTNTSVAFTVTEASPSARLYWRPSDGTRSAPIRIKVRRIFECEC